jgi:hypothetical protein
VSADQWQALLLEPASPPDDAALAAWFDAIATRLLTGTRLLVSREPHRFTEVEVYYHGPGHLDPFTHRDPIQVGTGLWYFHRTAGVYRGGSFKGFDLTFGGKDAFGGILIRGLEPEGGVLIDGPSLCVDHLIARTGAGDVATLDRAIAGRPAWDPANPLALAWLDEPVPRPILKAARVGLSLKRMKKNEAGPRFLLRRYRHLSEPRRISKGKLHMALALHADGAGLMEIRERTGCTNAALLRYLADYEEGRKEAGFDAYFGIDLGPKELARLHGLWREKYGG